VTRRAQYRHGRIMLPRAAWGAVGLAVGAPVEFLLDRDTRELGIRRMRSGGMVCGDPYGRENVGPLGLSVCRACCRAAAERGW